MSWQRTASLVTTIIGAAFWLFVVLALVRSPWWWLSAGVAWASYVVLKIAGARDVLSDLLADRLTDRLAKHHQAGGDGSTNYQAGGDVIVSAGVPEGTPSAERGQFWLGLGGHSKTVETTTEREARERADYVLLQARLRHPAGKERPRDN